MLIKIIVIVKKKKKKIFFFLAIKFYSLIKSINELFNFT